MLAFTHILHLANRMPFSFTVQCRAPLPILYLVPLYPNQESCSLNRPVLVHLGSLIYALYLVPGIVMKVVSYYLQPFPLLF
jgi:peptidoglycan/LPS O-acetylase OafA/YrhL